MRPQLATATARRSSRASLSANQGAWHTREFEDSSRSALSGGEHIQAAQDRLRAVGDRGDSIRAISVDMPDPPPARSVPACPDAESALKPFYVIASTRMASRTARLSNTHAILEWPTESNTGS
jgi:hypothetical protein